MKFVFGDIVVIDNYYIGVVVKCWCNQRNEYSYEVYVRSFNCIKDYKEEELERYLVRHKELSEDEQIWQEEAVNGGW